MAKWKRKGGILKLFLSEKEHIVDMIEKKDWKKLIRIGKPAVEPLIKTLEDDNSSIRYEVAKVLEKIGWKPSDEKEQIAYLIAKSDWKKLVQVGKPAVEPLIKVLGDEDVWDRHGAAEALGKIGDAKAVEPLIRVLGDDDREVGEAAAEALEKIRRKLTQDEELKICSGRESEDAVLIKPSIEIESKWTDLVSVIPLKSEGAGRTLIALLWVEFGLSIIPFLFILSAFLSPIAVTEPAIYSTQLVFFFELQALLSIALYYIILIIFLQWMYRLHSDLPILFSRYPISPMGALGRLIIPFYSTWGIWNTFGTLADRLKLEAGDMARWGSSLRSWLPWLYITIFASSILNRLTYSSNEKVSPGLLLLTAIVDICLFFVWLQMAITIRNAVNYRANKPSLFLNSFLSLLHFKN
ncbi:MAG: HEAT repeat domain-containing protein [Candidatus Methanoperedens sp.]|nr:HEAT repeat domain-containing protein [Candidatus Methanoperedens sp.]